MTRTVLRVNNKDSPSNRNPTLLVYAQSNVKWNRDTFPVLCVNALERKINRHQYRRSPLTAI